MTGTFKFLSVIALAAFIGVSSANYIVYGDSGLFKRSKGEWVWWPSAGSTAIDPYSRFYFMSQSRLPLSKFETVEVEATTDKEGRPLDADCIYQFSGRIPLSRWWTLASFAAETKSAPVDTSHSLSSHDVLFEENGTVNVIISKEIQAGNWIKPVGNDEFGMLLRIYNPINNFGGDAALSGELPSLSRQVCK